jgi:hypothetical protein
VSTPSADTPETRAALALPTAQAATAQVAAALDIHRESVRRLRKRLGVVPAVTPKGPPLVVRVSADLRAALAREAAFLRAPLAEVARAWMAFGKAQSWTALDTIHAQTGCYGGGGRAACGAEYVRFIGPQHPGWPGVTCAECRKALGMEW